MRLRGLLRTATTALAACAALSAPAFAQVRAGIANDGAGAMRGSPVQIESCIVSPSATPAATNVASAALGYLAGRSNGGFGLAAAAAGGAVLSQAAARSRLAVRFANEGAVDADLVRVRIDAGDALYVRDAFLLRGGEVATRTYSEGSAAGASYQPRSVACSVDFVHFSDGTTWSRPDVYRRQAVRQ